MGEQEKTKIYLCFMHKLKQGYLYKRITKDYKVLSEGTGTVYKHKMGYSPGDIVQVQSKDKEGTTIWPKSWVYIEKWPNREERKQWIVQSEIVARDNSARKLAGELKKDVIGNMTLRELKGLFSSYKSGVKRSSLIAYIIEYLYKY